MNYQAIIDKYYPEGTPLRDIYMRHAESVAGLAEQMREQSAPELDAGQVRAAAMLHDIGIFLTSAPDIHCFGLEPYIAHGPLGGALLRREGAPEWAARVAERHTGTGIPPYLPETTLERLICIADKFYSKSGDMRRKSLESVEAAAARFGPDNLAALRRLLADFPLPSENNIHHERR